MVITFTKLHDLSISGKSCKFNSVKNKRNFQSLSWWLLPAEEWQSDDCIVSGGSMCLQGEAKTP